MNPIVKVKHHGKFYTIEINKDKLTHEEAWGLCGDGTWIYCKETNTIERVSIGSHSDISYNISNFNPKNTYHKVISSSHPLWVWWGQGCLDLKWGDDNIALPKLNL